MNMLPNYILAFILTVFLIYSFINIKVKKAKVSNGCLYIITWNVYLWNNI